MNDICLGDVFYFDTDGVRRGLSVPDYMKVSKISEDGKFVTAKYEARTVAINDRLFSYQNLWFDSNLNPKREKPNWIFVKGLEANASMAQGSN